MTVWARGLDGLQQQPAKPASPAIITDPSLEGIRPVATVTEMTTLALYLQALSITGQITALIISHHLKGQTTRSLRGE